MNISRKLKIAVGGIWHETNTFSSLSTAYGDFERYQLAKDSDILGVYRDTNTEIGGVLGGLSELEVTIVPTVFAAAVPSGVIKRSDAERLCGELIERLIAAGSLDGVILALHGAAAAEGIDDLDGTILQRVRNAVGRVIPIVATFDYHANISDLMVSEATVLLGYDTFPHTDMAERGCEAANVAVNIATTGVEPKCAFRKIPLLTLPLDQQTDLFPMRNIMTRLSELEKSEEVVCGSVAMGFPYSDVPFLGASVLVYGDSENAVNSAADTFADEIWNAREEFVSRTVSVERGVKQAAKSDSRPVVLVESADNVGGGSAGDGTGVLAELLKYKNLCSVVVIADAEAVKIAESAGIGNSVTMAIGGKTDDQHGATLEIEVVVKRLSDGRYVHEGSYMTGYVTEMGKTAVVATGGVQIVLTTNRTMPFDANQLLSVGIEPDKQDIIVVKSAIAWKAAYGDVAEAVIEVDSPGACPANFDRLNYRVGNQPLYPLDLDLVYSR